MKKTLINFTVTLVGLFIILSFLDFRGDYVAEQIIWKANIRLSEVSKNSEVIPDKVFKEIADPYRRIIKDFPNSKLVPTAYVFLGRAHIIKKDYDTARRILREAIEKYPQNPGICAEATSTIGSSYERQGDWPKALEAYEKITRDYPLTDLGLSAPLYIANYYVQNSHTINAQNAFDSAVIYYDKIATENPNSEIEFKSLRLLTSCYLAQKKWREAIDTMGKILLKYPIPTTAMPIITTINAITVNQLKDYDVAIGIYQNFIKENARHPLNKTLNEMISALDELKKNNEKGTVKKT